MILDGKTFSLKIKDNVKAEVEKLIASGLTPPSLAVVLVGSDAPSQIYVNNKKNACAYVGIKSVSVELNENISQAQLEKKLNDLNNDKSINGILLQLPLPKGLDERRALNCISPIKDVDGLTNLSLGKLTSGEQCLTACTPTGIMELLKEYKVDLCGKHVVIINRSNLVGKPLAQLMLKENATVTICHSKTKNLKHFTKHADVLVTAVGKNNFITADMIKKDSVIVDVAIVRMPNGICGDVDFENVGKKAKLITPVPGGVGPLTIATLMQNTVIAYKMQNNMLGE